MYPRERSAEHDARITRLLRFRLCIAAALSTLLFSVMFLLGEPAQAQPALNFLNNPLKLTLAAKQDADKKCNPQTGEFEPAAPGEPTPDLKTTKATVWVRYTDSEEPLENLKFEARAKANTNGDVSTSPWKDVSVCWEPANGGQRSTLEALAVRPFEVSIEVGSPPRRNLPEWDGWGDLLVWSNLKEYWEWFLNPSPPYEWSSLSGYLLVRGTVSGEEAEPGTLSLQLISPAQGYKVWFLRVLTRIAAPWVVLTFVFLSVWALIRASLKKDLRGKRKFKLKEGWATLKKSLHEELDFDIKAGWASTLTTAGAVLGTFLSAGIISEDTFFMAKGQYTALNVIFALVILLAYLLYRSRQRGYTLLLAGVLILGAAAGELATVWLLLYELSFQGILSTSAVPLINISIVSLMQIILVCTALAVTIVAGQKLLDTIKKGKPAADDDKEVVRRFYKAWEDNFPAELGKILAPYYVYHDPQRRQYVGAIRQKIRASHNEFNFIHFVFEDQSAGEGKVGSRIVMRAERPPADGGGAAADEVSLEFIDICRVAGGKIEEQWIRPTPESWRDA